MIVLEANAPAEPVAKFSAAKAILDQISHLSHAVASDGTIKSTADRRDLRRCAKELGYSLEKPHETMQRIVFLPFTQPVVRAAVDLGLLEFLQEAGPDGRSVEELVKHTGAEDNLLSRLLRILATLGLLSQTSRNQWVATPSVQGCTIPALRAGIKFMFDLIGPVVHNLPQYLARISYKTPTVRDGPLQNTYETKLDAFDFVMQDSRFNGDTLEDLNVFMAGRQQGAKHWLEFYPFRNRILAGLQEADGAVTMVDVGGGLGHGLSELKEKIPEIKGRLVLQDLPKTIAQAASNSNGSFELMPHSFWEEQPVKGARVYYLRQVLHDWADKECHLILSNLAAAMKKDYSIVLINEYIVPEEGAGDFIAGCDLVMMSMSAGMERTEQQWSDLLAAAGLKMGDIWTFDEETESVIEAVLA